MMSKFLEYTVMVVSMFVLALMIDMAILEITPSELYQDIISKLS